MSNDIFGLAGSALKLSEDRAVLLTSNLVNASTPHFKAKDIDFNKALKEAGNGGGTLLKTNAAHITPSSEVGGTTALYRVPNQTSLDGNTVDDEIERKNFIENALHYQVNLTFVQNKASELMKAIKGE
ncbi:MAG: flagellar basal body rod protein FlgB [Gammaproteobacteria bacterium]|nr:flagellar basal body rod protein FlgB [Gammaproteobacteria bacterium]